MDFFPHKKPEFKKFHMDIYNNFRKVAKDYDFFKRPLSLSLNYSERDLELLFFEIFKIDKYIKIKIDQKIQRKKIDFLLKNNNNRHFIEIKDCGFFEAHYQKAVSICDEIEEAKNVNKVIALLRKCPQKFKTKYNRHESKVKCLEYYADAKTDHAENIAKDIYKLNELYKGDKIVKGDVCSCINFVYWPLIYGSNNLHTMKMDRTEETLKLGTELLIDHLSKMTDMKNLTHFIKTIPFPPMNVFHPLEGKKKIKGLKLTIEILSWAY